jgi:hypothetical protein
MRKDILETVERLIRVQAVRRGAPVEILVHYEINRVNGCDTYSLFSLEDAD